MSKETCRIDFSFKYVTEHGCYCSTLFTVVVQESEFLSFILSFFLGIQMFCGFEVDICLTFKLGLRLCHGGWVPLYWIAVIGQQRFIAES